MGDAKLLAGAGAWLGWAALPGVVLLAAFTVLSLAVVHLVRANKDDVNGEIPFGPHLAFFLLGVMAPRPPDIGVSS